MKGDADVIKVLQDVLTAELTAINQYFLHAEILENRRYHAIAEFVKKEAIDEMKHAEKLIERILSLDGLPDVQRYFRITVGKNVQQMFEYDLAVEYDAVRRLNKGIETCVKKGDNGSREVLVAILKDEERHIDWIEAQRRQIKDMGIENYLSTVVKSEDEGGE